MKSATITLKVGDSIELGRFKNVTAKILDIKKIHMDNLLL